MKFLVLTLVGTAALAGVTASLTDLNPFKSTETKVTETVTVPSSTTSPVVVSNSGQATSKTIEKLAVNKDRVLYLDEEVNFPSVTPLIEKLKELNAKSSDDIFLLLDSPGGSVLDGGMLISEIQASKAHVYTVCTRICASMAAMIHSYGYKRYSLDRAILMYHPASGGAQGQIPNLMSQLTTITKYMDRMVANIVSRGKVNKDELNRRIAYEVWEEAEDGVAEGFNDSIVSLNVPYYQPPKTTLNFSSGQEERRSAPRRGVTNDLKWIAPDSELYLWDRNANHEQEVKASDAKSAK